MLTVLRQALLLLLNTVQHCFLVRQYSRSHNERT